MSSHGARQDTELKNGLESVKNTPSTISCPLGGMAAVTSHFNRQGGALISIACHSEENFLWVFERKCRLTPQFPISMNQSNLPTPFPALQNALMYFIKKNYF
jgi:hypothetical protein